MGQQDIHRILRSDYLKLLPIMVLAFYLAFIPHHNYPYPVHVDEWMHLARSQALLQAGSITVSDPFYGAARLDLTTQLHTGFYLFWATFHQISGIPWLAIFKYFPGIVFMLTVLSVFVLARRWGFGWEAALFTCLIPTTVGILGPGFLVPVALGLLFIPLSLLLAFNVRTWSAYAVLFIFSCFLLSMHPPTAVGLVIILVPYILLNLRGNFKHSLGIMLALVIPFVLPFSLIRNLLLPTAESLLTPQPLSLYVDIPPLVTTYGYLPILFCIPGIFLLAIRGGKKNYGLVLGLLALLAMLVIFFTFHYGVTVFYERGLIYAMLMMSIVAGAGLAWVKNLRLPAKLTARVKTSFITKNLGGILCLIFIGLILTTCIPSRLDTPYYHMIDDQDYAAFLPFLSSLLHLFILYPEV